MKELKKKQQKSSKGLIEWMKNLELNPTGIREIDINIKKEYDVKRGMKAAYRKGYEAAKNGSVKDCQYDNEKLWCKTAFYAGVADYENGHKFNENAFE